MKYIDQEAFQRAKTFLYTYGRPLDQRRYEYHFEGGTQAAVLEALIAFQNEDGGFGRGLEPDIRADASSVIATSTGFGMMREVGISPRKTAVQLAVQYLLDSYDKETGVWPIVPPEVENAPHAWWWGFADSAQNFNNFLVNPRAAVAGHLQHYCVLVPADFLAVVKAAVLQQLDTYTDTIGHHDFDCFLGLAEADGPPQDERVRIVEKLVKLISSSLNLDRDKWDSGEVFKPLVVAPLPDSVLIGYIDEELIHLNLDIEIESQLPNGSWPLGWDWSPIDQAAWNAAERDWKGMMIVTKLRMFREYGRLQGSQ